MFVKIGFNFCFVGTITAPKDVFAVNGFVYIQAVFSRILSITSFVLALERFDFAMLNRLMPSKVKSSKTGVLASLKCAFERPQNAVNLPMTV